MPDNEPYYSLWALKYIVSSVFLVIATNSPVEGCDIADDGKYRGEPYLPPFHNSPKNAL